MKFFASLLVAAIVGVAVSAGASARPVARANDPGDQIISAMTQLGREPEEAAQITGAGWFRRIRTIVMPIQKGSLATGIVLPFISGIKELSIVIMLTTTGTQLLTTLSINLIDFAYDQMANAVVLVIALVAFLATYLTQRLTRTSLASGLGG